MVIAPQIDARAWNGVQFFYPAMPVIPIKTHNRNRIFTERPWSAMGSAPLRLHPFLGLTLGAILVGLLTPEMPELTLANGFWEDKEGQSRFLKSINWSMSGFGTLVGKIGFVIAMAAIIGTINGIKTALKNGGPTEILPPPMASNNSG